MKRFLAVIVMLALFLAACGKSEENKNIAFTALIESVYENSMMVTTTDDVGFDKAMVGYDKNLKMDFTPAAGQTVEIIILPEIRESYPVQVTAVKILFSSPNPTQSKAEYRRITAEEAKIMIDEGNVVILDVREQYEYDEGHIENAVLLPYTEIGEKAATMLPSKEATILVYCRSGRRSEIASKELVSMGYTGIYDFGGISSWPYEIVK